MHADAGPLVLAVAGAGICIGGILGTVFAIARRVPWYHRAMYPALYPNPEPKAATMAALGATLGTLVIQSLGANLIEYDVPHRETFLAGLGAAGLAFGTLTLVPAPQRLGATLGGLLGFGANYAIGAMPGPLWLRVPLGLLAIPMGAYLGARLSDPNT